jgi:murein hydrolase activator
MTRVARPILLVVIAALGLCVMAAAQPDSGTNEDLEAWKARLGESLKAEQSLLRQLYVIESEQRRQERELAKLSGSMASVREKLGTTELRIAELEGDTARREQKVGATLRRLYRLGQGGMWKILFESPDLKTFLFRYKALIRFLEQDATTITIFEQKVREIGVTRSELRGHLARMSELRYETEAKRRGAALERSKRSYLLDQIQRDKALAMRATQELAQQDQKIAATIQQMPAIPPTQTVDPGSLVLDFANRKGYLKLPVSGPIVGGYGRRVSPRFGTVTKSNGLDIAASLNAPVYAVADGTVRYVGEFLGYGRVLILDHGDRYHSLYAHLETFTAGKGDAVKAGTAIGTVGNTGALAEPVLHFEIRHKGVALNPSEWLGSGG